MLYLAIDAGSLASFVGILRRRGAIGGAHFLVITRAGQ
jgi:hypothetical protein